MGKSQIRLRTVQRLRFRFRLRQIQKRKNPVAGRHAVHGNVKKRPEKPQRDKKFRGQQNQYQRSVNAQASFQKF